MANMAKAREARDDTYASGPSMRSLAMVVLCVTMVMVESFKVFIAACLEMK